MSVSFWVGLLQRVSQRCVCVSSGVLVRFAPCDPGVRVLFRLCRSTFCAGVSDGVLPRRLCEQKPLQTSGEPERAFLVRKEWGLFVADRLRWLPPHQAWAGDLNPYDLARKRNQASL